MAFHEITLGSACRICWTAVLVWLLVDNSFDSQLFSQTGGPPTNVNRLIELAQQFPSDVEGLLEQKSALLDEHDAGMANLDAAGKAALMEKVVAIERKAIGLLKADAASYPADYLPSFMAATTMNSTYLANLYSDQQRFDAAIEIRKDVAPLIVERFGKKHWRVSDNELGVRRAQWLADANSERRKRFDEALALNIRGLDKRNEEDWKEAINLFQQGKTILEELELRDDSIYGNFQFNIANTQAMLGENGEAERGFTATIELEKRILGDGHPSLGITLNAVGDFYRKLGNHEHAIRLLNQAADIRRNEPGDESVDLATTLNNLALVYHASGEFETAERLYLEGLDLLYDGVRTRDQYHTVLNNLIVMLDARGEFAKAENVIRRAIALAPPSENRTTAAYGSLAYKLGYVFKLQNEPILAELMLIDAKRAFETSGFTKTSEYALCLENLSKVYLQSNQQLQTAELYQHQATEIAKSLAGEQSLYYGIRLLNFGSLMARKSITEANTIFDQALRTMERAGGTKNSDYLTALENVGTANLAAGNFMEAIDKFTQCLPILEELRGKNNDRYAAILQHLADAYARNGDDEQAQQMLEELAQLQASANLVSNEPVSHAFEPGESRPAAASRLKLVGLAVLNYESAYLRLPFVDPNRDLEGEPPNQLSWRVRILPFLDHLELFEKFDLQQPFDSPHNRALTGSMPDEFGDGDSNSDVFWVNAFENEKRAVELGDITDGTSETIMLVHSSPGETWTNSRDLTIEQAISIITSTDNIDGRWVVMYDGSTRKLPRDIDDKMLRALLTVNGGEKIDDAKN
jgi:tetratricopeptide (TPR) repeat protein